MLPEFRRFQNSFHNGSGIAGLHRAGDVGDTAVGALGVTPQQRLIVDHNIEFRRSVALGCHRLFDALFLRHDPATSALLPREIDDGADGNVINAPPGEQVFRKGNLRRPDADGSHAPFARFPAELHDVLDVGEAIPMRDREIGVIDGSRKSFHIGREFPPFGLIENGGGCEVRLRNILFNRTALCFFDENVPEGILLALMLLCGEGFLNIGVEGIHIANNIMFLYSVHSCSFDSIGSIYTVFLERRDIMKRYDGIAFAGALGALAGLSVAITHAWEIVPTILSAIVCMVVAGVAYSSLEILLVLCNACRDLPAALQSILEWWCVRKEKIRAGMKASLFVIWCIASALISFLAIPILLFVGGMLFSTMDRREYIGVGTGMVATAIMFFGVGVLIFVYLLMVCTEKSPPWAWRMGKAFRGIFEVGNSMPKNQKILLLCLCFPILMELMSIGVIVLVLDVLSTLLLALASTERIAAILGAILGWGTGVLFHSLGMPGDLLLLATGSIVGWFAGSLLYRLREYLSQEPVAETVRS